MARNATSATCLTVNEYDNIYGGEAGWESWFGEARRKPEPTKLHGLLQLLLGELLRLAGYVAITESDLRIVDDWRPRPDVHGVLEEFEGPYATRPVDVVFEVLSDGDDILMKCCQYSEIHIETIFVFDPVAQSIARWDSTNLVPVTDVKLPNSVTITGATIWSEFAKRQKQQPPASMTI